MKLGTKQFAVATLAAALAGVSAQASALTLYYQQNSLITDFEQTNNPPPTRYVAGYGADTLAGSTYSLETATDVDGFSSLAWNHNPANQNGNSSLALGTHSGVLEDDGAWVDISTLTQTNKEIYGTTTWDATISSNLQFFSGPVHDDLTFMLSDAMFGSFSEVDISFNETYNGGSCPFGNPAGTICDDYWTFDAAAIDEVIAFVIGGTNYLIDFRLDADIPDQVITGTGEVWTGENETNILRVQARLREVPEPGVLALMGLGLVGLFFAARRRKS
ncbi:MAG: PEP-CTERM sorting domain-containing protein [Gammaproteobacteria bacterium]|nr:PEP-CTERM sorting domain-containing protein [Gammaproteobacteria bacterium]